MANAPRGREKNYTGQGKDVYKRGDGLGTGPVGNAGGYQNRPGTTGSSSGNGGSGGNGGSTRAGGKRSPLLLIIIAAVVLLGGGGAGLGGLFGGGSTTNTPANNSSSNIISSNTGSNSSNIISSNTGSNSSSSSGSMLDLSSLLSGVSASNTSTGWTQKSNNGVLDTTVASGARAKRTKILGNGKDTVTIMVYMCGTDLESSGGMGTADLSEMANATIGDNVNLIVYTGGCKRWKNNIVSSTVNQIYKVESGGLRCLEKDMGKAAMTKPATLTEFIKYCNKNYKANRNMLIFWDHGGGSLSGYGYDEKYASSGSMTLKGINEALSNAGATFDFIGFDACLMATTENALMLSQYADYMIGSEETEPGVGWYYTNWLTKLSKNTSMPTIEIGKTIVDDFVDVCAQKCAGQKTTLSIVDLAELETTAPQELKDFSAAASELLQSSKYETVANARSSAREFSPSSKLDQVDLVSFAQKMGTQEGNDLAKALLGAVKYNRTSTNMTDAYGLSIYFPYKKVGSVDNAVATFDAIGMDDEYLRCIQQFASIETGGQAVAGGSSVGNPLFSLLGGSFESAGSGASMGTDMISSLLGGLLGGDIGNIAGLTGSNSAFLGKSLDVEATAQYLSDNSFDSSALVWLAGDNGQPVISIPAEQWALVQDLELNLFVDDGEGYIDLGLDNVYDFTDDGDLIGAFDGTWIAINQQPVAYYLEDIVDDGTNYSITGRVPVMLNGQRADLILVFNNDDPDGFVAGARYDYRNGETETVAKSYGALNDGDVIDFLCDYYRYDGSYEDSYYLGDQMVVDGELTISNVDVPGEYSATYRITDIYQQEYWTPEIP